MLFDSLAKKNNPLAEYWVGHMSELGLGVPRDPAKAIEFYKKAVDQDVAPAELRLGEMYLHGNLVLPDFTLNRRRIMVNLAPRCCWAKCIMTALECPLIRPKPMPGQKWLHWRKAPLRNVIGMFHFIT